MLRATGVRAGRLCAVAALAGSFWASSPAHGDDAMLKLLEVLHDNGTISTEAYDMLKEAAKADAAGSEAEAVGVQAEPPAAEPATGPAEADEGATVKLGEAGLEVRSGDGDSRLKLGGRIHVDAAHYEDDGIPLGDGSDVRRLRLEGRANVAGHWSAAASLDFAGGDVSIIYGGLQYDGFDNASLFLGRRKQFFSLEEQSTSNNSLFMERPMMTAFAPGTHSGIAYSRWTDSTASAAGLFADAGGAADEGDAAWGASGRFAWFPVLSDRRLLHLGGALSYWETGDDDLFRLRARPESRLTNVRLVDTGGIEQTSDVFRAGLEAAGVSGPLTLQGEYAVAQVDRYGGLPDPGFSGWYASAGWALTGESRGYRSRSGRMGTIVPERSVSDGGIGAWEIAARYSTIDLTDDLIVGGEEDNFSLGLNWYVSPNVRFMFNYVNVLDVDRPGAPEDGEDPDIYQIRTQFNY